MCKDVHLYRNVQSWWVFLVYEREEREKKSDSEMGQNVCWDVCWVVCWVVCVWKCECLSERVSLYVYLYVFACVWVYKKE